MIKTEAEIKLEVGLRALEKHLYELDAEIAKLEPTTVWEIAMKAASIQGVVNYMKGDMHNG